MTLVANALRAVAEAARRATAPAYAVPEHVPTPAATEERGPFLIPDLYWRDLDGRPDWDALLGATWGPDVEGQRHRYAGAILKATQGTAYRGAEWFELGWRKLGSCTRYREGDFVRGAYHYLNFWQDGTRQAEYYLRTIDRAGGWGSYDVLPIVDIEFGADDSANRKTPRAEVERNALAFVNKVKKERGACILYGGSALGELRIRDRLGCRWLWPAAYTARMSAREAMSIGWRIEDVVMWQFTDGKTCKAITTRGTVLPRTVPGFGAVDCSVFLAGSTWPEVLSALCDPT